MISVVVPTRNSALSLPTCLASLRIQPEVTEVIVVDNHSTDGTPRIAREFGARLLTLGPERCAQRNAGLEAATGEFIAFIDSDMILAPSLLTEALSLARAGADAVILTEDSTGQGYWARVKWLERRCYHGDDMIEAARFFRRDALVGVGGYDEVLNAFEDWDLHHRVVRSGASVARTQSLLFHDEGDLALSRTVAKKGYYAKSRLHYARKHPALAARQTSAAYRARVFARHLPFLLRHPGLLGGLLIMKSLEAASAIVRRGRIEEIYPEGAVHA